MRLELVLIAQLVALTAGCDKGDSPAPAPTTTASVPSSSAEPIGNPAVKSWLEEVETGHMPKGPAPFADLGDDERGAVLDALEELVGSVRGDVWLAAAKTIVAEHNAEAGVTPVDKHVEIQLAAYRRQTLQLVLEAMIAVDDARGRARVAALVASWDDEALQRMGLSVLGDELGTADDATRKKLGALQAKIEGPASEANVSVVEVSVAGGSIAGVQQVVAKMKGRFARCYSAALRDDATLAGDVVLTAKIDAKGAVESVAGGGGALATVVACSKVILRATHFAAPEGGGVVVSIALRFTNP